MERCIHQVFESTDISAIKKDIGNCAICVPDEFNQACKGYCPITIYTFEVIEKEDKK